MLDDPDVPRLKGGERHGIVHCSGRLDPMPQASEFLLNFSATNVPLEEELRNALGQPNMHRLNDLRLADGIWARQVYYRTGDVRPRVEFHAEFHSENSSIEPVHFPYRLEKLRGVLVYRDGQVTIEKLRGEHGETELAAAARCVFLPDGSWHLCLENLHVDRLRLDDRELMQALPERLKHTIAGLNPVGPTSLSGTFEFAQGGQPGDPLTSRWDLAVGFCQTSVDFGLRLENLNGGMKLQGDFDGRRFQSRGELDLDTVGYRNVQFTRVQGPFWIDDEQVLFAEVDRFFRTRPDGPKTASPPSPANSLAAPCMATAGSPWAWRPLRTEQPRFRRPI